MLNRLKRLPSPALVIAFIALVAALGTGSAVALVGKNTVAADDIKKNAVGASEIKKNAVGASEIKSSAVRSSEVQNNSLTGADIDESSLNVGGGGGGGGGANIVSFSTRLSANQTQTQDDRQFHRHLGDQRRRDLRGDSAAIGQSGLAAVDRRERRLREPGRQRDRDHHGRERLPGVHRRER